MQAHFNALRKSGCTVSQVNKAIKAAKAIFTYAFDSEYLATNIMQRYPKLQRVEGERAANRGVFSEVELRAIFESATPFELALTGILSISGPHPGEIYALDWSAVHLDLPKPYFRIERTWCSKGFRFYPPKTAAGRRTVPISAWLDTAVAASEGALPRSVLAALDVCQSGPSQWRSAVQRLAGYRTRPQHDRRHHLRAHSRFGGRRCQRKCCGAGRPQSIGDALAA